MNKPCGVILVAGKGARMHPFSAKYPKTLLPVCNKPLIIYQIELMKSVGINEVYIVIGYLGYQIVNTLGDGDAFGIKIKYIEQNEPLGIAHAVGTLERYIGSSFLLMLGDIYFVPNDLGRMISTLEKEKCSAVLAVKEEERPELVRRNFTVMLRPNGDVTRVIEKPRYSENCLKGCGIYLFEQHIFDAIRRTPRTAMRNEYELTDAIQILIDDGYRVRTENVIEEDVNLTFPEDVRRINQYALSVAGMDNVTGINVDVHPEAIIVNSVLGNNIKIEHPIHIRDSVIFDGVNVVTRKNLDSYIITPDFTIDCHDHEGVIAI